MIPLLSDVIRLLWFQGINGDVYVTGDTAQPQKVTLLEPRGMVGSKPMAARWAEVGTRDGSPSFAGGRRPTAPIVRTTRPR
jgi:hypothetical protein